jgi:hypothetical protein
MKFNTLIIALIVYIVMSGALAYPLAILLNYALYPTIIAVPFTWLQAWALMIATGILSKTSVEVKSS